MLVKFNHVGVSVPNIEKAIKFYSEAFEWTQIGNISVVKAKENIICRDIFGESFNDFRMAHMLTGDKIGFELFEFPENQENTYFKPYQTSYFHVGILAKNIEKMVSKIIKAGGSQMTKIHYYSREKSPYRMVYMKDPFGNILEVYTHKYEEQNG